MSFPNPLYRKSSVATSSSISSSLISRQNTNIPPITPVGHYTNVSDVSSASHPMIAHSQAYASYIHQQSIGSPNVSRVLPVKKPHISPIFVDSEPTKVVESGHQMPELIADQHAIKNSSGNAFQKCLIIKEKCSILFCGLLLQARHMPIITKIDCGTMYRVHGVNRLIRWSIILYFLIQMRY